MSLHIDDAGTLREVYFDGDGCCISQAAASMLVEKFDGRPVEEVKRFTADDMLDDVRRAAHAEPAEVLSAAVAGLAGGDLLAGRAGESVWGRGCVGRWEAMSTATATARLDPAVFRPDFPILAQTVRDGVPLVYLDNAATSQRPRQVIQAIVETYERHYANVHRGIHWLADQTTDLYENAREAVRRFINAPARKRSSSPPARPRASTWWPGVGAMPTSDQGTRSC